jgi:hypothetical protein
MRASPIADLAKPLVVVAHDAGAANLILAWLDPSDPPRALMEGPARALWRTRMGDAPLCLHLDEAIEGAATLLSGTGWASDLEHNARVIAGDRQLRSIAVVDHWTNYQMRFVREDIERYPDEIWVVDAAAFALARSQFDIPVVRQHNTYLETQIAEIGPAQAPGSALLVMEPIRDNWAQAGDGEFQMLDWFMTQRSKLGMEPNDTIYLRPHPSDPLGKFDAWLACNRAATLDDSPTLAQAIGRVGIVAGAHSQAMVVALAAGRRVVCALPPWAPACRLPFGEIERLG